MRRHWWVLVVAVVGAAGWAAGHRPAPAEQPRATSIEWRQPLQVDGVEVAMAPEAVLAVCGEPTVRIRERWVYASGLEILFRDGRVDEVYGHRLTQGPSLVLQAGESEDLAARLIRQPRDRYLGQYLEVRQRHGHVRRIVMSAGERQMALGPGGEAPKPAPAPANQSVPGSHLF